MPLGVYVHLAFCPYLCPYCDFAKWPYRASAARRYLEALEEELDSVPKRPAATVFIGGGTPNTYDATTLAALVSRVRAHFASDISHEVTVEVNPELVRADDFPAYRDAGVTRLSIGVQSFDADEARTLGRKHSLRDVERAVAWARKARVPSVSVDLIFAVPGQTPHSWRTSLQRAIALGVDHISTYGLTVEEGTPYASVRARDPGWFLDDAVEAQLYEIAMDELGTAGYEQYEISNFARPGHRCAHNENYWANGEYVGMGVGAASYVGGVRSTHARNLSAYVDAALAHVPIPGESERLDGTRRAGEAMMLALRTAQGVGLRAFKERYDIDVLTLYANPIAEYTSTGLLERHGDFVRLTRRGRLFANDVCAAFLEVPPSA
ncbi:MAG TPA: radical SAM family heme chaperone HemW [Candidatus Dormibacteraeota bacterium]|nr:radical SAM family heme chaperone HemW [Candidatus Dormibacteraeota bacterium]